ncbi:hypothetical protein D9M72_635410 [compost metagenome]
MPRRIGASGTDRIVAAEAYAARPRVEATERSMFRVRITSIWPIPTMPSMAE